MLTPQEMQCTTVLYAALSTPHGLVLLTNNPAKARAALYTARKTLGDPELARLTIRVAPNNVEKSLWLIHNNPLTEVGAGYSLAHTECDLL